MRSRRVLGVADQALSSASNVAITVVAARALDPESFGSFAVAFATYLVATGLARALVTEPLLLQEREEAQARGRAACGGMALVGAAAGIACVGAGGVFGGRTGAALAVLGAALPVLLLQDAYRYAAFAARRPARALASDATWVAGVIVAAAGLAAVDDPQPALFMAAWAGAGAMATVVGALGAGYPPGGGGARWIRQQSGLGGPFTIEFLAGSGGIHAGLWLLGVVSGLPAAGALRVALTVFGPINVIYVGLYVVLVPEGADLGRSPELRRLMARVSWGLVGVAAAWTVLTLAIPQGAGEELFGETWSSARPVLLPVGAAMGAGGLMAGAIAGLRALGEARASLRVRLWTLPAVVLLPLAGALAADEVGFATGFAAASWLAGGVWWRMLSSALARDVPARREGR